MVVFYDRTAMESFGIRKSIFFHPFDFILSSLQTDSNKLNTPSGLGFQASV